MDKAILDQLSFGFEIEGAFRQGMWEKLGFKGEFVHDGSVRVPTRNLPFEYERIPLSRPRSCRNCTFDDDGEVHRYCTTHHARYRSEGSASQEYSSDVYQDFAQAMKAMKLFNTRNHVWDYSCGLHFHVGVKNKKYKQLWGIVSNYKYLKQLLEEARGYCSHQAERLRNRSALNYCTPYNTRKELIQCTNVEQGYSDRQKYRFVRFHPEHHTLEFRFLVPCEHKVANVQKLMASLTAYIGRTENVKSYSVAETDPHEPLNRDIEIPIKKAKSEKLDTTLKLFKGDSYRNSNHFYKAREFQSLVDDYGEEQATAMFHRQNEPQQVAIPVWDEPFTYELPPLSRGFGDTGTDWVVVGSSGSTSQPEQSRDQIVIEVSHMLPGIELGTVVMTYDQMASMGRAPGTQELYSQVYMNHTRPQVGAVTSTIGSVPMGTVLRDTLVENAIRELSQNTPSFEEDED